MLHSCCSTFTCCQIYAHHIISLQQSLQDLHLVSNLNILSEPAPLMAIPLPLCLGPPLISISGIICLLSAAACIPLNLALCVHSTSLPQGTHLQAATLAPIRPTTPRSIVVSLSYKVSIPTFAECQALFLAREASLAVVAPGVQTRVLSFPSVKDSFDCFHCFLCSTWSLKKKLQGLCQ